MSCHSVPGRGSLPVAQHILHGRLPLILEASCQLLDLLSRRLVVTPHISLVGLGGRKACDEVTSTC